VLRRPAKRVDFTFVAAEEESRKPLHSRPVMRRRGLPFQARIVVLTLAGGLPALLAANCAPSSWSTPPALPDMRRVLPTLSA
jgi:hypothetical protein